MEVMSNPWADIYDDLRSPYLQEKKAKKDYDGDGKIESGAKEYRGVVHNKIQKAKGGKADGQDTSSVKESKAPRMQKGAMAYDGPNKASSEAKDRILAKAKNKKKEVDECWKTHKKVGMKMKGGKMVPDCRPKNEDVRINNVDGTTTEIVDVITAPKMIAAPKFSNWREDFIWDDPVEEAVKNPKLDIQEKGVKNKVEVNPTLETEEQKYDNTKSPDYEKKKKALAKKHGGEKNIKGHPQYEEVEQIDEIDNMGSKLAIGAVAGAVGGGLKLMQAAKNAAERMKKKREDKMKQLNMGEEVEKKNLDEAKVKYYSGQDRNPNTGLPKGLKSAPVRTEKEVNKKLDRTTLAQSYEPEGESIVDESVYDTVKKALDTGSNFMKKNPVGKALSNVVKPFKSTDGGSNRTSATAASQKAKGLRVAAEEVVTELNRYEKETGKSSGSMNMPKGRPTKKGGTSSPVMRAVRTKIRKETGKPHGQQKKTKGVKGNPQPGDRKTTPADTIAKRRQSKADAEKLMRDTSGT